MKKLFAVIAMLGVFAFGATQSMMAQEAEPVAIEVDSAAVDSALVDTAAVEEVVEEVIAPVEEESFHKALKTKFIEGDA